MAVVSPCFEALGSFPQRTKPLFLVPIVFLTRTQEGLFAISERKVGTTSSPHGLHGLGYTRVTLVVTKAKNDESRSEA